MKVRTLYGMVETKRVAGGDSRQVLYLSNRKCRILTSDDNSASKIMEAFGCNPSAKLVINLIQSGGSVDDVDFWTGEEVGSPWLDGKKGGREAESRLLTFMQKVSPALFVHPSPKMTNS